MRGGVGMGAWVPVQRKYIVFAPHVVNVRDEAEDKKDAQELAKKLDDEALQRKLEAYAQVGSEVHQEQKKELKRKIRAALEAEGRTDLRG
jgi:hypothetical protein